MTGGYFFCLKRSCCLLPAGNKPAGTTWFPGFSRSHAANGHFKRVLPANRHNEAGARIAKGKRACNMGAKKGTLSCKGLSSAKAVRPGWRISKEGLKSNGCL